MILVLLSVALLIAALFMAFRYRLDVVHPGFWTNLGFCGYSIGGFYYGLTGYEGASFLNLAGFSASREGWFLVSFLLVLIGFAACNFGFYLANRKRRSGAFNASKEALSSLPMAVAKAMAAVLICLGLAFWFYMASVGFGGVVGIFAQVAAYPYIMKDAGLSALPLHLLYGGVELWALLWAISDRRQWIGLLPIPLAMLVILSTGSIAFASAYGFSIILAYSMIVRGGAGWKTFSGAFAALMPINIFYYFFRQYTSYLYIGQPQNFPLYNIGGSPLPGTGHLTAQAAQSVVGPAVSGDGVFEGLSYILRSLVGGGNIPDLQQLVLITSGLLDGRLRLYFGATYADSFWNLIDRDGIQSVGYRILREYFPAKVGGPTPGMIGEALINFGPAFPIALVLLTFGAAQMYMWVIYRREPLLMLLYCKFVIGTWALFLKVDSSLLLGFLIGSMPIIICWIGLKGLDPFYGNWKPSRSAK